jgi:hypothetical protein
MIALLVVPGFIHNPSSILAQMNTETHDLTIFQETQSNFSNVSIIVNTTISAGATTSINTTSTVNATSTINTTTTITPITNLINTTNSTNNTIISNTTIPSTNPLASTSPATIVSNLSQLTIQDPYAVINTVNVTNATITPSQITSIIIQDNGASGGTQPYTYRWLESYNGRILSQAWDCGAGNNQSINMVAPCVIQINPSMPLGDYHFNLSVTDATGNTVIDPGFQLDLTSVSLKATDTVVSCTTPLIAGTSTTCTATVTGSGAPAGTVAFSTTGFGSFGSTSTCTLVSGTCSVTTYTDSVVENPTVTATYLGDSNNAGSVGTESVTVNPLVCTLDVGSGGIDLSDGNVAGVTVTDTGTASFNNINVAGTDWYSGAGVDSFSVGSTAYSTESLPDTSLTYNSISVFTRVAPGDVNNINFVLTPPTDTPAGTYTQQITINGEC